MVSLSGGQDCGDFEERSAFRRIRRGFAAGREYVVESGELRAIGFRKTIGIVADAATNRSHGDGCVGVSYVFRG